tara:strand:+ start:3946 stop:4890 length:945 start_codon:yes stop_codon:yes gene_type:complete
MRRKVVKTKSEFLDWFNQFNGKMNCYTTVYDFEDINDNTQIDSSVILDRMFLDFDAHGKPLELAHKDFVEVAKKLESQDIMFRSYFSGKGFHIIALGERVNDIRCIQQYYTELAKDHPTLDSSGIQINRLRRIPNSMNLSTTYDEDKSYFCIPINYKLEDLDLILQSAKNIVPLDIKYGSKRIKFPTVEPIEASDIEVEMPKPVGSLPILPCLHNSIMVENPSHNARVYLIHWWRDLLTGRERNISPEQQEKVIDTIMVELEKIASLDEVWLDWNYDVTKMYVSGIVSKGYHTPSCDKLIAQGYCVGKCWRYVD